MPETPFPSQEELQKKIQEFMKANFGDHVAVSAFTQQATTEDPPEERQESIDPFQFNATDQSTPGSVRHSAGRGKKDAVDRGLRSL
jgi:hypothetical protein